MFEKKIQKILLIESRTNYREGLQEMENSTWKTKKIINTRQSQDSDTKQ